MHCITQLTQQTDEKKNGLQGNKKRFLPVYVLIKSFCNNITTYPINITIARISLSRLRTGLRDMQKTVQPVQGKQ